MFCRLWVFLAVPWACVCSCATAPAPRRRCCSSVPRARRARRFPPGGPAATTRSSASAARREDATPAARPAPRYARARAPSVQRCKSCESYRRGFGWGIAHGAITRPADFPRHDGTLYRGIRVRRWGLGVVPHSRVILCHAVPTLRVTIRNCCIAVERQGPCEEDPWLHQARAGLPSLSNTQRARVRELCLGWRLHGSRLWPRGDPMSASTRRASLALRAGESPTAPCPHKLTHCPCVVWQEESGADTPGGSTHDATSGHKRSRLGGGDGGTAAAGGSPASAGKPMQVNIGSHGQRHVKFK